MLDRIHNGDGLTFVVIVFLNFSKSFLVMASVGFAGWVWVNRGLSRGPAGLHPSKLELRFIVKNARYQKSYNVGFLITSMDFIGFIFGYIL